MSSSTTTKTLLRKIIQTSKAPAPIGHYSQAVQINQTLYISGQIGMDTKGSLVGPSVESQTRQALDNIGHILTAAGASFNHVVKSTVLLSDISMFQAVNKIYGEYFRENHPARAAYQVAVLPKDSRWSPRTGWAQHDGRCATSNDCPGATICSSWGWCGGGGWK